MTLSPHKLLRAAALTLTLLLASCAPAEKGTQYFKESGERFHTLYHLTYRSPSPLTAAIDSTMQRFDDELNNFKESSFISAWNRSETDSLSPMLQDVLLRALEVSRKTGGVYDVTGSPLFDLWGFGAKKGVDALPTDAQVDSVLEFVGYAKLTLDTLRHKLLKADPRMTINPSSLSKGYVTDLVAQTLEERGVTDYMVEIGGEIVARGVNPDGNPWRIGISKPVERPKGEAYDENLLYAIEISEKCGMASSGDYRNYKIIEGKKLAHTLNVLTGRPAHQDILGATVVAPTCMEADAWATAFMSLGLEKSIRLLNEEPQLRVLLIYAAPDTGELKTYEKGLTIQELSPNK